MMAGALNAKRAQRAAAATFEAAITDRLKADWTTGNPSPDAALNYRLPVMRARMRDLERNDAYIRRWLALLSRNVVGPKGIRLQSLAENERAEADTPARRTIERAWRKWGEVGSCTVDGRMSWADVKRLALRAIARDGEVLIRIIRGPAAGNAFGFALQVIEADQLDDSYSIAATAENPARVSMGVELNAWGRPLAYHMLDGHPGEVYGGGYRQARRQRLPAESVLHIYQIERAGQTRGIPWAVGSAARLKMLDGYEEAELVAARVAAAKMGFFVSVDGQAPVGETGADGQTILDAEAGAMETLPPGTDFRAWDPQHPAAAFPSFVKSLARGASAGLDVAYASLTGDLESVNYSSIRQGSLDERDKWRELQGWMIDHLCKPVFDGWLPAAMLAGEVRLPMRALDRFAAHKWQPRGWQWIDPAKESQGNATQVDRGWKSDSDVAAEHGRDLEEIYEQKAADQALAKSYGVSLATTIEPADLGDQDDD